MGDKAQPILITGSHRSGSTWVGRMLAVAPDCAYVHEPFNVGIRICVMESLFSHWFTYVGKENEIMYKSALNKVIDFKYPLISNSARILSIRNIAKLIRDQGAFFLNRVLGKRAIIKDPIAFFSAPWLSQTFDMQVLVLVRHPAAFCSSLKLKGWTFDFNNFLEQPLLMNRYLTKFEDQINDYAKNEKDIIDQAILLWNIIHHTAIGYQRTYADWIFIKHEDLSRDPLNEFKSIYEAFDLSFTDRVQKLVRKSSGMHNPVEQVTGKEHIRNSLANIYNWKKRLTLDEVEYIKKHTSEVASNFYSEGDW